MSSIYLLLSPNCNLSCKYCFQTDNVADTPGKQYHAQPAAKATVAIIDQIWPNSVVKTILRTSNFSVGNLFFIATSFALL